MPSLGCSEHRRAIRASGHDVLHRRNDSCLLKAGAAGVATGAFCEGTDVRVGEKKQQQQKNSLFEALLESNQGYNEQHIERQLGGKHCTCYSNLSLIFHLHFLFISQISSKKN